MLPGRSLTKDPKVTVLANSVDCWLFVKLEESDNLDEFLDYSIAQGWTRLQEGVYYREVAQSSVDREFSVILDDTVTVLPMVTKQMLNDLDADPGSPEYPTLTVTAYAVQKSGFATAEAAWAQL